MCQKIIEVVKIVARNEVKMLRNELTQYKIRHVVFFLPRVDPFNRIFNKEIHTRSKYIKIKIPTYQCYRKF